MNIALIGCGRIGFLLENDLLRYKPCTHFGGAVSAGLKINYASDINKSRLKKFSNYANIQKKNTFINYKDLLNNVKLDLAIIATWTESHESISIDAARKGTKIIILEKPIAPSLKKSKKILKECRKNDVSLIINHERRYDNRYRKLKELIKNKKIGEIKTVYASILTAGYSGHSNPDEGGGPLLHDGTHLIDILRYLFGDIISVEGEFQRVKRTNGFEDRALAWMKTENNIDIFLEAGGSREYFSFELEISGTKGKFIIGNGYEKLYLNKKSKFYSGFMDIEERAFPGYIKNNCFNAVYKEAKQLLEKKEGYITSNGIDGYRALEVIHAVYLSSFSQRKILKLPINPNSVNLQKIFNIR